MADLSVAMIYGPHDGHLSRCIDGAPTTSKTEALDGVLGRRYTPHSHQVVLPRLLIAVGRMRDYDDIDAYGEGTSLDCFSIFFAWSFFVNFQGPACILFLSRSL